MPYQVSGRVTEDCSISIFDFDSKLLLSTESIQSGQYTSSKFSKQNIGSNAIVLANTSDGKCMSYGKVTPTYDNYSSVLEWVTVRYNRWGDMSIGANYINFNFNAHGSQYFILTLPKVLLKNSKKINFLVTCTMESKSRGFLMLCNKAIHRTDARFSDGVLQACGDSIVSSITLNNAASNTYSLTNSTQTITIPNINSLPDELSIVTTCYGNDVNGAVFNLSLYKIDVLGNDDVILYTQNFGTSYSMPSLDQDGYVAYGGTSIKRYGYIPTFLVNNV